MGPRFKLSQTHPWTEDESAGFVCAVLVSSVLFALFMWWIEPPDSGFIHNPHVVGNQMMPDPGYHSPVVICALMFGGLLLFNAPPIKRLHGFFQYLICVGVASFLSRNADAPYSPGLFDLIAFRGTVYGFFMFCWMRANWWFLWDYPSRRGIAERILCSIFYTTIFPLGLAMGFARLAGIGVNEPTTQFVVDPDHPDAAAVEQIPDNPALIAHANRVNAVRSTRAGIGAGRTVSADKDAVSGSI